MPLPYTARDGLHRAAALRFACIARAEEVPVITGPGEGPAAGHGRLRASHADREQVIYRLKTGFADGRLDKGLYGAPALAPLGAVALLLLVIELPVVIIFVALTLARQRHDRSRGSRGPLSPRSAQPDSGGPRLRPRTAARGRSYCQIATGVPGT
jgi:hypothetical protein